jgi:hypothetical protein
MSIYAPCVHTSCNRLRKMDGSRSRRSRRSRSGVSGRLSLGAVSACSDTEAVAQSGRQTASGTFFDHRLALIRFTDATESCETLFHRGVAHATRVQRAVEVVGETAVRVAGLLTSLLAGFFRGWGCCAFGGWLCLVGVFVGLLCGFGLRWVEVNAAGI